MQIDCKGLLSHLYVKAAMFPKTVVLQKVDEDRKLPGKTIN